MWFLVLVMLTAQGSYKVIEIGPGYGGQSIILEEFFNIDHYSFIDLPQVNKLIKTFVNANSVKFTHNTGVLEDNFTNEKFDLVISNYAFSELNRNLQIKEIYSKNKYQTINRLILSFLKKNN